MLGNAVTLLRDGEEAFPQMVRAIEQAERSVYIEMYILDHVGAEGFDRALIAARRRGVEVHVLYDSLGSIRSKGSFFRHLRDAGVDVRSFRPLHQYLFRPRQVLRRDHRKLVSVDGKVAFVGGINIAQQWKPRHEGGHGWREDVIRVEGPVVPSLDRRFRAMWYAATRERLPPLPRDAAPFHEDGVRAYALTNRKAIHRAYLRAITAATESIVIANAYFVPDRAIRIALRRAARRGVKITLMLNARSDHWYMLYGTRSFYTRFLKDGIRIYEWRPTILHSKTAVVDGTWATVGSYNLERTSLHLNFEMNLFMFDPEFCQHLKRSLAEDFSCCSPISLRQWRTRPLWQKVLERICYTFRRFL